MCSAPLRALLAVRGPGQTSRLAFCPAEYISASFKSKGIRAELLSFSSWSGKSTFSYIRGICLLFFQRPFRRAVKLSKPVRATRRSLGSKQDSFRWTRTGLLTQFLRRCGFLVEWCYYSLLPKRSKRCLIAQSAERKFLSTPSSVPAADSPSLQRQWLRRHGSRLSPRVPACRRTLPPL